MTTFLCSILTAGSDKMFQSDPHGWILTLVSVSVVFLALIILFFIYNFSGNLFQGKYKKERKIKVKKGSSANDEVAAAIAMAIDAECGSGEVEAAIATALHLHLNSSVHDYESGIITIRRSDKTNWNDKQLSFRKYK